MGNAARKERKRNLRKFRPMGMIADPDQFAFRHPDKSALPLERKPQPEPDFSALDFDYFEAVWRATANGEPVNPRGGIR